MTYPKLAGVPAINIDNTADILLADVAIRLQLTATEYRTMESRYLTLSDHIDRAGSPLHGKIARLYAQGSVARGDTNRRATEKDEFDVDAMVEVLMPQSTHPEIVLSTLHKSVVGTPENPTRYAKMTVRHTRCVQIRYEDGMHVDLTPTILLPDFLERTGFIFHSKPEDPTVRPRSLPANPWGFADYFAERTPPDLQFSTFFENRSSAYDRFLVAKADAEDIPEQKPIHKKSKAVISLQLIKRMRDNAYQKFPDLRLPPTVLLALWTAQNANVIRTPSLLDELIHQAGCMFAKLCQPFLVSEVNPRCGQDVFTDRWPVDIQQQRIFAKFMGEFLDDMMRLKNDDLTISDMQDIMVKHFGERPVKRAVEHLFESQGQRHRSSGGLVMPRSAKVVVTGAGLAAASSARAIASHNFHGEDWSE